MKPRLRLVLMNSPVEKLKQVSCKEDVKEMLEMALKDLESGDMQTERIVICTDEDRYVAGFKNDYELTGFLNWKIQIINNG